MDLEREDAVGKGCTLQSLPAASPGAELSWLHPQSAAALISAERCQFGAEWSACTFLLSWGLAPAAWPARVHWLCKVLVRAQWAMLGL